MHFPSLNSTQLSIILGLSTHVYGSISKTYSLFLQLLQFPALSRSQSDSHSSPPFIGLYPSAHYSHFDIY